MGLLICHTVSIDSHFAYHWYDMDDQKHLSDTMMASLASAGLMTVFMSWALAAL